ncbi:acetate--CoA ligase family protein [Microbacterium sp. No. 7]|uniref:acetate--CoA ligase family protein n=1 Tax=Microbacterium sp. No. 7 TaxID=1714373 RepID=UPI0006D0C13A|nr:acetate--CoA ligase family protein [Microbacterium sp. No. 7]ALJ21189.1 hypothetical protein AOA12_15280 [Microbacterium sp. No. 7]
MTDTVPSRHRLDSLLKPASVALVGASPRSHMSHTILQNFRDFGYAGKVYPVNPKYEEIDGLRCYPSVTAIDEPLDTVVLLVPADAVPAAAREAVEMGAKSLLIMSAGFSEDERGGGKERERLLLEAVAGSGIVISGPNTEGFYNVTDRIPLTFSQSVTRRSIASTAIVADEEHDPVDEIKGGVAIVAQSGGLGFSLFGRGIERGICFSHVISVGNELDVDVLECAEYLFAQPEVRVVGMYVEGFHNPERLRIVAEAARAAGKAFVIGKAGSSEAGGAAALSHTGHLAGEARVNDAIFDRLGIIGVRDQDEFLDACATLSVLPPAAGNRVGIVSWSGGSAVWTADACEREGLVLPQIDPALEQELAAGLPEFAGIRNPIDITAAAKLTPGQVLQTVSTAEYLDSLILIAPMSHPQILDRDLEPIQAVVQAGKPVVAYSYTRIHPDNAAKLARIGVPSFESSTRAARAIGYLSAISGERPAIPALRGPAADAGRRVLSEREATQLLSAAGLPAAPQYLATSADEAADAVARIGKSVAMKVQAPSMPHKKDAGGVELNVAGEADARRVYDELRARTAAFADVEGVLVQEMVSAGLEMLVGVSNTSGFGPMMLVGFGGSGVEHLADTAMRAAPLSADDVRDMLAETRHGALLLEPLGALPDFDLAAFTDFVVALSEWVVARSERIHELDINPVIVSSDGVTFVDAMIVATADGDLAG